MGTTDVLLPDAGVTAMALCGDGGAVVDSAAAAVVCDSVNLGGEDVSEESDNRDNKLFVITSKQLCLSLT
jgi:ATP-dependent protease HslVU (ClpYQ) peptidase subunit